MRAPLLLLAAVFCASTPSWAEEEALPRPVSPSVWAAKVQRLGGSKRLAENEVDLQAIRDAIFSEVRDATDGTRVRFSARISEVRWKDGVAQLWTADRKEHGLRESSQKSSLKVTRATAFDAQMTSYEAASIKKGAKLQVDAILHAKWQFPVWGNSDENGQLMFKVTSPTGHARYYIGCFSLDYTLTLNGRPLRPEWAAAGGLLAAPEEVEP